MLNKYVFRKYNPKYKLFFLKEKRNLVGSLGKIIGVRHVGSTAVKGLGGKGIVDILVGVKTKVIRRLIPKLEKASYEYRKKASTPQRLFFRKDYKQGKSFRRVHIHLTRLGGKDWREIIAFKNFLLENPLEAKKYGRLKREAILKAKGDGDMYKNLKKRFIEANIKKHLSKKSKPFKN
ncbi:MAG: GrpB family protein [Nanoarchaeota archaeon]